MPWFPALSLSPILFIHVPQLNRFPPWTKPVSGSTFASTLNPGNYKWRRNIDGKVPTEISQSVVQISVQLWLVNRCWLIFYSSSYGSSTGRSLQCLCLINFKKIKPRLVRNWVFIGVKTSVISGSNLFDFKCDFNLIKRNISSWINFKKCHRLQIAVVQKD